MIRQIAPLFLITLFAISSDPAHATDCDNPKTSDEVAQCLGVELREADAKINTSYKELMGRLDKSDRVSLRMAQRAWIKARDINCQLDNKETDREKWYQTLLKDYPKTVCVTRYTRKRTGELEKMLENLNRPSHQAATQPNSEASRSSGSDPYEMTYDQRRPTTHSNGKWYFELTIDYATATKIEPCALYMGVTDKHQFIGILDNIRERDVNRPIMRYGFAVDLDNGKLYHSKNGQWFDGAPGSNQGSDVKLNRTYFAAFATSTEDVTPYINTRAIVPNFGDRQMTYALPAGYRPWRSQ